MDQSQRNHATMRARPAPAGLPGSVAELRTLVLEQQKKLEQQALFIEQLLEQIRLARHQHFGARSERFSVDQLALAFNEAEAAAADTAEGADVVGEPHPSAQPDLLGTVAVPAHRRTKGGRRPLPKAFPRVEILHEIEPGEGPCGGCCGTLVPISEKVSEQLDIQPARIRVLRHVRKTYTCTGCPACEGKLVTAPMPPQPIPKSLASPGTLAHVAVAKYVDGLPLYRQQTQCHRTLETDPFRTKLLTHLCCNEADLVGGRPNADEGRGDGDRDFVSTRDGRAGDRP